MKKLYLIKAKEFDYEEYDSVLIRADNIEEAEKLLKKFINNYYINPEESTLLNFENYTFKEIKQDGETDIIIASFNAG